jgi:RNA polymerase primary sigma factor
LFTVKQETTMGKVSASETIASVSSKKSKLNPMKTNASRPKLITKNTVSTTTPAPSTLPASECYAEPDAVTVDEDAETRRNTHLDAFTLYMREVGLTRLLSPQDEIGLAKRIKKGDCGAREMMIKANLRLVVKIAHDYENAGLPLLDLVSEGNIGLMTAVERFDPLKGAKLSTYAAFWIKQSIRRALANQSKTIRLPVHVVAKLFHIRRAEKRLRGEIGRDPSDQELSAELGISIKRIASYREASAAPSSLDAPMGENSDSGLLSEIIPDEKAESPYRQLEEKNNSILVREAVGTLDARERTILRFRFGLDGDDEETLDVIGRKFGVTRERIRQIQEMALAKLRCKIEKIDSIQEISA